MKNLLKTAILVFFMSIVLLMQSCNNNEPGLSDIKLTMKASTALSTINPGGRVMNTGLVFTDIMLGVTEIEFETLEENTAEENGDVEDNDGDGEDDNEEIEFEGNFVVDLIAGTSTPDFGVADIAPGIYEEIEIELSPILDGDITMFIAFDYTPDGATDAVRYEYSTSAEMEFELEKEGGFLLDENTLTQILVIIDLDAMFANIDLNTAIADVDGIVRINNDSNTDLANQIAANLGDAMHGGEDEDGDGEIDDD
jgi:hypothetical protein